MPKKKRRRKPGPPRAVRPGAAPPRLREESYDEFEVDYELYEDQIQPVDPPRQKVHRFDLARRLVGGDGQRKRLEDQVARLVNSARAKAGLPGLQVDERLRKSARAHGADMEARNYFAHESPDGGTPFDRMLKAGYPDGAAENIARGQQKPNEVMQAWMNSPGHRRNILHPNFRTIGVGMHMGEYGPWWTQHFGY